MKKWKRFVALGTIFGGAVAAACTGDYLLAPTAPPGSALALNSFSCGVTYTAEIVSADSELATYGIPTRTDTVQICETWTGSDYQAQVTLTGSSRPADVLDTSKSIQYSGGMVSGYAADGGASEEPVAVGATAFDVVDATQAERDASYADPYYGVVVSEQPENPPPTCGTPETGPCKLNDGGGVLSVVRGLGAQTNDHGLKRGALKALLREAEEVDRSAAGHRRFKFVRGDEERITEIDPQTELISAQEVRSPRGWTRARLQWTKQRGKYVRERMDTESEDVVDGQAFRSRVSLRLLRIDWNAQLVR
ncbi:MAG TPA: hypothetical protein VKA84_24520 [Gemmatimonadaceae bacterium]|nr:hypothetical protein [Gemmatimonadaceae bacterium]